LTLNIALNTIIIIMVFLFPGIIARKSFFSGPFKNRYENGSLIDKFAWNILVSIVCIALFSLVHELFLFFTQFFQLVKLSNSNLIVTYKDLYCIFESLSKNELPSEFNEYGKFIMYLIYLMLIYGTSFIFGHIFFYLVTKFKLERKLKFLQFRNHWEFLSVPNIYNFSDIDHKKNYDAWVDVMIGDKENKELFRGIIEKIVYDKENKIEHILLKKTIQFIRIELDKNDVIEDSNGKNYIIVKKKQVDKAAIHVQTENYIVYKKVIDGNIFVIPANNIKNLNFTYFETEDPNVIDNSISKEKIKKLNHSLKWDFTIGVSSIVASLLYSYYKVNLNFIDKILFLNIVNKIIIGSYLILVFILLTHSIKTFLKKQIDLLEKLTSLETLIVLSIPILSILYDLPLIHIITIICIYMLISSLVILILNNFLKSKVFIFLFKFTIGLVYLWCSIEYLIENPNLF